MEKQGKIKSSTRIKKREQVKNRMRERRKKLAKKIGKLFLVALFLVGLAFGISRLRHFAMTSSHFQIEEVDFRGLGSLQKEELRAMAGIELGENIFNISPREVTQRLKSYPIIRSAAVRRVPPRKVFITIEERRGIALIEGKDRLYLIDREGFLFFSELPRGELPHIIGICDSEIKEGKRLTNSRLQLALDIIEHNKITFSEIDLRKRHLVLKSEGIKLFFKEEQWEKNLTDAALIISDIHRRGEKAEYIDMRFVHPVIKLR